MQNHENDNPIILKPQTISNPLEYYQAFRVKNIEKIDSLAPTQYMVTAGRDDIQNQTFHSEENVEEAKYVNFDKEALQDPQGRVWAAIAVNVGMHQLQSAAFGFTVPEALREAASAHRVCEFLTLFAVGDPSLSRKLPLWREVFHDLHAAGFTHALATTAPKMLPLYRWIKAEVIGEAHIEGESRVFLQFHLGRRKRHP